MQIMNLAALVCGFVAVPALYKVSAYLHTAGKSSISAQRYKAAIALRKDSCRSVDEVVRNLADSNISPDFYLEVR